MKAQQNRVLEVEDNIVSTAAFDTSKSVGNPKLTIYDAMRRVGNRHVFQMATRLIPQYNLRVAGVLLN